VQDTLVNVYRHWSRVRQADSPDAYFRRILINEARDRWRRRDRAVPVADVGAEPTVPPVPDPTDDFARRDGLLRALVELPDHAVERRGRREQRRAVALRGGVAAGVAGIAVAGFLVAFRHAGAAPVTAPVAVAPAKPASGRPALTTAPRLDNVAYVRQQVQAARDPANSEVEMRQGGIDAGNPPETDWADPATANHPQIPAGFTQVPADS